MTYYFAVSRVIGAAEEGATGGTAGEAVGGGITGGSKELHRLGVVVTSYTRFM